MSRHPKTMLLTDEEMQRLQVLATYAQQKLEQAQMAQLTVDLFIRNCVRLRGQNPDKEWHVSPRGEIQPQPPKAPPESGPQAQVDQPIPMNRDTRRQEAKTK